MGPGTTTSSAPSVQLTGIVKRYGSVVACNEVDLALRPGRVHGILGENGAGKSTLMKILIGLEQPDAGTIAVRGHVVPVADPIAAAALGIAMVHQHYSLVEPMTVWENVVLGEVVRLDRSAARRRVREVGERYGLDVDPDTRIADLTAGQRQRVEIIKCLRRDPQIIIFDEPTSVLTPAESEYLFEVLRRVVADEGRVVALVSHKLDEILRATDEVTIMRAGRVVDTLPTAQATASTLAQSMVGRPVSLRSEAAALGLVDEVAESARDQASAGLGGARAAESAAVLKIRDAVVHGRDGRLLLDQFSIEVAAGEIVGLAGVEGNGQRALADVLSSLLPLESGSIEVGGTVVTAGRPGALHRAGVGVIPEDRHDSGCVLDLTVAENLALSEPEAFSRHGFVDRRAMLQHARLLMDSFGIQAPSPDASMRLLSGGNQQRVVLARELSSRPTVLVAAQPTRGLDVGAIEYMTARLQETAASGVGVLLISTELEEILALSHRICVIHGGRVVGEMARRDADPERLGLMLGGRAA